MDKELEKKLFENFPKIFRQKDLPSSETCMCWGCACDDGWYEIINDACKVMNDMSEWNPHMYPRIEMAQVKEKYGTLVMYYDIIELSKEEFLCRDEARTCYEYRIPWWIKFLGRIFPKIKDNYMYKRYLENTKMYQSYFDGVENYAGYLSSKTCEICGEKGTSCRSRGWMKTLCDKHMIENGYSKPNCGEEK